MGVIATGSIFKTLTFDGKSSAEFNVYITGEGVFNAPERAVEMISIPGRNGAFALDNGRFENIEVTYNCGIAGDSDTDFAEAVSAFRNWLCSRNGYVRLTDDYNADEYRMAVYKSGLEVTAERLIAGEFPIVFECKPQRFLTSGEDKITVGEWGETTTETGDIVEIENPDGILSVKSLTADINAEQDLNGYPSPWPGGSGINLMPAGEAKTETIRGITFTSDGKGTYTISGTATANASCSFACEPFTIPTSDVAGFQMLNDTATANAVWYFKNGTTNVDSWTISPINRVAPSYGTMGGRSCDNYTIIIQSGTEIDMTLSPMLTLKSVYPSATFEPYENICPITGWADCEVFVKPLNLFPNTLGVQSVTKNGVTFDITEENGFITDIYMHGTASAASSLAFTDAGHPYSIPAGTFKLYLGGDRTASGSRFDINIRRAGSTQDIVATTAAVTIINEEESDFGGAYIWVYSGAVLNHHIMPCIVKDGVDITGYPNYPIHNGTTTPVPLGQTVYGGTLDVVSGELTIDKATITYTGASGENWVLDTSGGWNRFRITESTAQTTGSNIGPLLCNIGVSASGNFVGKIFQYGQMFYYYPPQDITTASAFKTWLNTHNMQVVYPIVPTTTTLTAQQVQLLLGANNIWADTGNVTVEFGQNPNILVNPTLFQSRPMLEVTGSGAVNLGDDTIQINNDPIGDVIIFEQQTKNTASAWPVYIETQYANTDDPIIVTECQYTVNWTLSRGLISDISYTTTGDGHAAVYDVGAGMKPAVWLENVEFAFGTAATETTTATFTIVTTNYGTLTADITLSLAYDGASQLILSHTATRPTQFSSANPRKTIGDVILRSSQIALGNPIYIDLDIGEAYKIENDVPVSVNNGVVIPAELPTLAPGANTITYDNTITQLDIVPRWWKI